MNHIEITETLAITSNKNEWTLAKRQIHKDKESGEDVVKWSSFAFYGSFHGVVKGLKDYLLRNGDCETFKELADLANEIQEFLDEELPINE